MLSVEKKGKDMTKLRPVSFWIKHVNDTQQGFFHCWGQRKCENLQDFFGVVEDIKGQCYEIDAIQIRFTDNKSLNAG